LPIDLTHPSFETGENLANVGLMEDKTEADAGAVEAGHAAAERGSALPHKADDAEPATGTLRRTRQSINPYGFSVAVAAIVVLTKVASYLTPYKLYFTFSSFLFSESPIFRWEALALKLAIPAVVGFSLYFFPFHWLLMISGSRINYRVLYRYLARQTDLTAKAAGFFSALLMAWPFIVYWDIMMRPDKLNLKLPFLLVYFLYILSYSYFAGLGVALAKLLLKARLPRAATTGISARVSWLESVRTSALGVITSAIAPYFASTLGTAP
jgi:hypothetical protein